MKTNKNQNKHSSKTSGKHPDDPAKKGSLVEPSDDSSIRNSEPLESAQLSDELNEGQPEVEQTNAENTNSDNPVRIEFPYSEVVRARIPKAFEVAEKIATDWKNEGDFQNLGLPHPLANAVTAEALKKAKQVEKKLEEKGVFNLAKMGLAIAKSQVNEIKKKF